jgi:hypothetical protein
MSDDMWKFANENPWLTFFIIFFALITITNIVYMPAKILSRYHRHKTLRQIGWPPPHLDADGDFKEEENA